MRLGESRREEEDVRPGAGERRTTGDQEQERGGRRETRSRREETRTGPPPDRSDLHLHCEATRDLEEQEEQPVNTDDNRSRPGGL